MCNIPLVPQTTDHRSRNMYVPSRPDWFLLRLLPARLAGVIISYAGAGVFEEAMRISAAAAVTKTLVPPCADSSAVVDASDGHG